MGMRLSTILNFDSNNICDERGVVIQRGHQRGLDPVVLRTRGSLLLLRDQRGLHQERVQPLRTQEAGQQVRVPLTPRSEALKMIQRTVPPAEEEVDDPR